MWRPLKSKKVMVRLQEFLQLEINDIDEILRNCNFSESFIRTANDLQILEAISGCYEEYKVLSRR